MKRKLVKTQDKLLRFIQKDGKMFSWKHLYLTKRKFRHHEGLRFTWSLYHKAIIVNTWNVKVNQLFDTNLLLCDLHIEKTLYVHRFFLSVVKQYMCGLEL